MTEPINWQRGRDVLVMCSKILSCDHFIRAIQMKHNDSAKKFELFEICTVFFWIKRAALHFLRLLLTRRRASGSRLFASEKSFGLSYWSLSGFLPQLGPSKNSCWSVGVWFWLAGFFRTLVPKSWQTDSVCVCVGEYVCLCLFAYLCPRVQGCGCGFSKDRHLKLSFLHQV